MQYAGDDNRADGLIIPEWLSVSDYAPIKHA